MSICVCLCLSVCVCMCVSLSVMQCMCVCVCFPSTKCHVVSVSWRHLQNFVVFVFVVTVGVEGSAQTAMVETFNVDCNRGWVLTTSLPQSDPLSVL